MSDTDDTITLNEVEVFISDVQKAADFQALYSCMLKQVNRQGFDGFIYRLISNPDGSQPVFYLSSIAPEWKARYRSENYGQHDIVARHVARTVRPFEWLEICPWSSLTTVQQNIFNESREFGLAAGGTIPIHSMGLSKALLSVTSSASREEFLKVFMKERHELQLVATYFHERILQLYKPEWDPPSLLKLTPKELEILTWTAAGKQAWDIAKILSISPNTVKEHLQNACRKMGVTNKTHAVAIALINGMITP